jgi:hypothetical protein
MGGTHSLKEPAEGIGGNVTSPGQAGLNPSESLVSQLMLGIALLVAITLLIEVLRARKGAGRGPDGTRRRRGK